MMAWIIGIMGMLLVAVAPAEAADDAGIELTITVVDAETELPIPTAVVRHPKEKNRHQVNTATGAAKMSVLYMEDGTEVIFEKGLQLTFEISAPNYLNQKFTYIMRKRKNRVTVPLTKMNLDIEMDEEDDPVIQFGRDKPLDGQPIK
jgi:hypothetical protein